MMKMKAICNWIYVVVLSALTLCVSISCDSDDVELVDTSHSSLEVSCGSDSEIPVMVDNWSIEYVKDAVSGQNMSDKDGNPLMLDGNGTVEASGGWLKLSRDGNEAFVISLKENFDRSRERKILLCINSEGQRDYVNVTQRAGTEYSLVKSEYEEMEDLRAIYTSDEDCTDIVLSNPSYEEVWMPTGGIFKDVVSTSIFESDDYGAFAWMPQEGVEVSIPDLIIDGAIWGAAGYHCTYKDGVAIVPYIEDIANGSKILMRPYSTLRLSGEITYCRRVCNYTFSRSRICQAEPDLK